MFFFENLTAAVRSNVPTAHCTMSDLKKEGGRFLTKANSRIKEYVNYLISWNYVNKVVF